MNNKEFNKVITKALHHIKSLLISKGKEYTLPDNTDRLHNFNEAAHIRRQTPEDIWLIYYTKHEIWVLDAIKYASHKDFNKFFPKDKMEEHLKDMQVYLLLLEAIFTQRYNNIPERLENNE